MGINDLLTVGEVCTELQISPRTFHEWRAKRKAPKCIKLPNDQLRIKRADLESWLNDWTEAA